MSETMNGGSGSPDCSLVLACPVCGMRVRDCCFHDGDDVRPMRMEKQRSVDKLTDMIDWLQSKTNEYTTERDAVKNL